MDGTQEVVALLTKENAQIIRQLQEMGKVVQMLDKGMAQVFQEIKMINTKIELLEGRNDPT